MYVTQVVCNTSGERRMRFETQTRCICNNRNLPTILKPKPLNTRSTCYSANSQLLKLFPLKYSVNQASIAHKNKAIQRRRGNIPH